MTMRLADITPTRCIEWFVVGNFAFLGVDILIAHDANAFRHPGEWIPIVFSALSPWILLPGALRIGPPRLTRPLDLVVGATAIVVGVLGMAFHLSSAFFVDRTLRSLVYSAPFVAPLAYVGVGLLLILVRLESPDSMAVGQWALLLALGGFGGNFVLSLLDHAQNSFYHSAEWVPVVAAAYACSFLAVALLGGERSMLWGCLGMCGVQAAVGVAGFVLHVLSNANRSSPSLAKRFLFGAPAFAPLLFTNLAVLAALAVWTMLRQPPREAKAPLPTGWIGPRGRRP
jgi:hypothetical protein